jgi:hypothetical protein
VNVCLAGTLFSGYQQKLCSLEEWNVLRKSLSDIKAEVEVTGEPRFLKAKIIHIVIFPSVSREAFDKWMQENNWRQNIHGMQLQVDETLRIARDKIKKEAAQIAQGSTGIVYLLVSDVHFWTEDLEAAIDAYKKALCKFPAVLALVIHSEILDKQEAGFVKCDDYMLAVIPICGPLRKRILVVKNPAYDGSMQERCKEFIFDVLTKL